MEFNLTKESMELLVEQIVDAVESSEDRDVQFDMVRTILIDNGITEIEDVDLGLAQANDVDLTKSSSSRIDSIKAYKVQVEQEKIEAHNRELAEREELIIKIKELQPRIVELIETANACIENDIEINKYHKSGCYSSDDSWERGTFVTNGISHNVGFVETFKEYNHSTKHSITEIGIEAGGACGALDFRTDGVNVYSIHERTKEKSEPLNKHMKDFLRVFDKFEEAFYSYVDRVVNRDKQR